LGFFPDSYINSSSKRFAVGSLKKIKKTSKAFVKLEYLFWISGVVLLAVFFMVKSSNSTSAAAGIAEFQQARATAELQAPAGTDTPPPQFGIQAGQEDIPAAVVETATLDAAPVLETDLPEPDFSDWSEKRIAEYRESLEASSDLPLAVLSIDALKIKVPVYNGASDLNLNRGVARIKGTAQIDENSNLGIAGHRDGFFRGLQNITVGDQLSLDTLSGQTQYRVTQIRIVRPDDVFVLEPTNSRTLTLVTCYPFYFVGSAPKRYIVTAEAETLQVQS
jgi:sortase A